MPELDSRPSCPDPPYACGLDFCNVAGMIVDPELNARPLNRRASDLLATPEGL